MMPNSKALVRATVGVIWLVVVMTIAAELSEPFKALLAGTFTHHWIGKSVISVVAFVVFYAIFSRARESDNVSRGAWQVVWSVVLGGLIIFSFFLWHFISG